MGAPLPPSATRGTPILKLFGTDPALRDIRDKIYSNVWSRGRRDDKKLDWVVSQRGFNRNVPERFISKKRLNQLLCNLHLTNKQISDDFLRYIYSCNDLEIDVDLKASYSEEAEDHLQRIVTQLQNPNFQKYTQSGRVRIHFPSSYPVNNLPSFNFHALDSIAASLDQFQRLEHLAVRVVLGQGSPRDYELRFATFPFYPMRMTNWSVRTLASVRPVRWDLVDQQEIHQLDQAFYIYVDSGSLTASVTPDSVTQPPASTRATSTTTGRKTSIDNAALTDFVPKTGSQKKKKNRKQKLAAKLFSSNATASTGAQQVKQDTATAVISTEAPDTTSHDKRNGTKLAKSNVMAADLSHGKTMVSAPKVPPSPPDSPSQPQDFTTTATSYRLGVGSSISAPTASDTIVQKVDTATPKVTELVQGSQPPSPAPSSVTLASLSDNPQPVADLGKPIAEDCTPDANVSQEVKRQGSQGQKGKKQKRKKHSKESKNSAVAELVNAQHDPELSAPAGEEPIQELSGQDLDAQAIQSDRTPSNSLENILTFVRLNEINAASQVDLSKVRLIPLNDQVFYYHPVTGKIMHVARTAQVNRYLRLQERRQASIATKTDEQKQIRDKRGSKKAKQLMLRRGNVATASPLSRATERHRVGQKNVKQPNVSKEPKGPTDSAMNALADSDMAVRSLNNSFAEQFIKHSFNFGRDIASGNGGSGSTSQESAPEIHRQYPSDEECDIHRDIHSTDNEPSSSADNAEVYHSVEEGLRNKPVHSGHCLDAAATDQAPVQDDQEARPTKVDPGAELPVCKNDDAQMVGTDLGPDERDAVTETILDYPFVPSAQPDPSPLLSAERNGPKVEAVPRQRRSRRSKGYKWGRKGQQERETVRGQDANKDQRNGWAAAVVAGDKEKIVEKQVARAEMERKMAADGTEYADYDNPISDNWIKTDGDGKNIEGSSEQISYSTQRRDNTLSEELDSSAA